ncbi:hypothetical protein K8S19_11400 [bacterium]|nr:hypothetical protein [bacterium]
MSLLHALGIQKKKRSRVLVLAVLLICLCCLRPVNTHAATSEAPENLPSITAMSVVLFYAGVIGALVGAATGWVHAWFLSPELPREPVKAEETE